MLHRRTALSTGLAVLLAAAGLLAAEPLTQVSVDGMHCPACAKKIATKIQMLPTVATALADAKSGLVSVTPKPEAKLSPRSLWETVEAAGYKPVKLVGPAGTFTTKPKQ